MIFLIAFKVIINRGTAKKREKEFCYSTKAQ